MTVIAPQCYIFDLHTGFVRTNKHIFLMTLSPLISLMCYGNLSAFFHCLLIISICPGLLQQERKHDCIIQLWPRF